MCLLAEGTFWKSKLVPYCFKEWIKKVNVSSYFDCVSAQLVLGFLVGLIIVTPEDP